MELKQYLSILRRWSWLLISGANSGRSGRFLGKPVSNAYIRGLHSFTGDACSSADHLGLYLFE